MQQRIRTVRWLAVASEPSMFIVTEESADLVAGIPKRLTKRMQPTTKSIDFMRETCRSAVECAAADAQRYTASLNRWRKTDLEFQKTCSPKS